MCDFLRNREVKCKTSASGLQGAIDADKELQKLQKSLDSVARSIAKLEKAINVPTYVQKVPIEVRAAETEKLSQLRGELSKLEEAKKALMHVLDSSSEAV